MNESLIADVAGGRGCPEKLRGGRWQIEKPRGIIAGAWSYFFETVHVGVRVQKRRLAPLASKSTLRSRGEGPWSPMKWSGG